MSHEIIISDSLYIQLADFAVGFDTPENVIQKLVNAYYENKKEEAGVAEKKQISTVNNNLEIASENLQAIAVNSGEYLMSMPRSNLVQDQLQENSVLEDVDEIYKLVKSIYDDKITEKDAKNILMSKYEITETQAQEYIQTVHKMILGKCYQGLIPYEITDMFLRNIYQDFSVEGLSNALSSLKKHITYRQSFPNNQCDKLLNLYNKFNLLVNNSNI